MPLGNERTSHKTRLSGLRCQHCGSSTFAHILQPPLVSISSMSISFSQVPCCNEKLEFEPMGKYCHLEYFGPITYTSPMPQYQIFVQNVERPMCIAGLGLGFRLAANAANPRLQSSTEKTLQNENLHQMSTWADLQLLKSIHWGSCDLIR